MFYLVTPTFQLLRIYLGEVIKVLTWILSIVI
jgi:hypothetical protein